MLRQGGDVVLTAALVDRTAGGTVGRHTDCTYDALSRPTIEKTYQGPGTGTLKLQTTRTYLGDGRVSSVAFDGTGAGEGTDTLDLTYDAAGRPDQVKRGATVLTDYAWDGDGTLASRLDETIGTTAFTFDWADRLVSTDPPDTYASGTVTQTWRLDGLLATKSWPTGISATAAYDAARRPTALGFGTAGSVGQAFDRDGNVTAETHTLSGVTGAAGTGSQSFTYDPLRRVTGSSGLAGYSRAYTYDLDGNRLTKTDNGTTTYTATFEATDQARTMTKTGGSPLSFGYTEFGDLTVDVEDGVTAVGHVHDIAGWLTGIDGPGTTNDASFALDALGRFRSRTINGATDTYGYAGVSETVSPIVTASPVDSLVDATGSRLGVKVGSTVNWFLPDPHGNVAGAISGTTVANALRYDAYGQTIATGTAGGTPVATGFWKHQGRLDIGPPGLAQPLYEAAARLYSPGLGTFTSLDSVMGTTQDPLSLNRYLYAEANPATLTDPTGHFVAEGDSTAGSRCNNGGDWGCGRTAATSKSKVRAAAPKPKRTNNQSHGNGRGATWRDKGDEKHTKWTPPSLDSWMRFSDDTRAWYSAVYWDEAFEWEGWGNNEDTVLAYWIVQAGTDNHAALEPLEAIVDIDKINEVQADVGSHPNRTSDTWSDSAALVGIGLVGGVTAKGKVPNPGGRLGDSVTRAKAAAVIEDLKSRGYTEVSTEVRFGPGKEGSGNALRRRRRKKSKYGALGDHSDWGANVNGRSSRAGTTRPRRHHQNLRTGNGIPIASAI